MKLEEVELKVDSHMRTGHFLRIVASSGEVAYMETGRPWEIFPTLRPLLEQELKTARWRFSGYKRACPGREFAERDIAFYETVLAQPEWR